jgi:hypothetical protein
MNLGYDLRRPYMVDSWLKNNSKSVTSRTRNKYSSYKKKGFIQQNQWECCISENEPRAICTVCAVIPGVSPCDQHRVQNGTQRNVQKNVKREKCSLHRLLRADRFWAEPPQGGNPCHPTWVFITHIMFYKDDIFLFFSLVCYYSLELPVCNRYKSKLLVPTSLFLSK